MNKHKQPDVPVYVVDLAGLQFQQGYLWQMMSCCVDNGHALVDTVKMTHRLTG